MPTAHLRIETLSGMILLDRIVLDRERNKCLAFLDLTDDLKPLNLGQILLQPIHMTLESAINLKVDWQSCAETFLLRSWHHHSEI